VILKATKIDKFGAQSTRCEGCTENEKLNATAKQLAEIRHENEKNSRKTLKTRADSRREEERTAMSQTASQSVVREKLNVTE